MIDLHCHILPGVDDGAPDVATSEEMARVAEADGVRTMVATPHIREDHPFPPEEVGPRASELDRQFAVAGVEVRVLAAGEVGLTMATTLDTATLDALCLGDGPWLLVESPYTYATDMLERMIFDIQRRGYRVLLAHPERSPSFMEDHDRVATLVERGVGCSITAGSVTGQFGRTVQRAALDFVRAGLVHDIASDAHDPRRRPPGLAAAASAVERSVPGLEGQGLWFVDDAPRAILAGEELPVPPEARRRRKWLGGGRRG
jgi:protein-tyrosine phosphatase